MGALDLGVPTPAPPGVASHVQFVGTRVQVPVRAEGLQCTGSMDTNARGQKFNNNVRFCSVEPSCLLKWDTAHFSHFN